MPVPEGMSLCLLASIWSGHSKRDSDSLRLLVSFLRPGSVAGLFLCAWRKTLDLFDEIVYLMGL